MKNKIFLSFLTTTTMLSFQARADLASDCAAYGITCTLDNGHLTISGSGETPSSAPWKNYNDQISSVHIDGFTDIGYRAFSGMTLDKVTMSPSVQKIKDEAFRGTFSEIYVPNTLTSIDEFVFNGVGTLYLDPSSNLRIDGDGYLLGISTIVVTPNADFSFWQSPSGYDSSTVTFKCNGDINICEQMLANVKSLWEDFGIEFNLTSYTPPAQGQNGNEDGYTGGETQGGEGGQIGNNSEPVISSPSSRTVKRIYTVEEAQKVSKKTGNTFRLRYK
ncbi:MAG TPA: hypothetical protein DIC64_04570 [Alphaproteobacteria bacterium]|nr:hypothetical protein [Alphaproteobacteria bacterium]